MNDPTLNPERKGPPSLSEAAAPVAADSAPYHMTDPWDIGEALAKLAAHGDALTIYPCGSKMPVMARVLSCDEELPHFVIELNDNVPLPPGPATLVAWLQSAKLQFVLDTDWTRQSDDPLLVPCIFPDECLVLERRQASRLETPLGVYYSATMMLDSISYELQLYDISVGGVGMRGAPRDTVGLYVGRKLPRVRLELGLNKVIVVDLEVRLSRSFRSFLLGEQVQIGCCFMHLTPQLEGEIRQLVDKLGSGRKH